MVISYFTPFAFASSIILSVIAHISCFMDRHDLVLPPKGQWSINQIEELLRYPMQLSTIVDGCGLTPLKWAILYQRWTLVNKLLIVGADPNIQSNEGITALHMLLLTKSYTLDSLHNFCVSFFYFYTNGLCTSTDYLNVISISKSIDNNTLLQNVASNIDRDNTIDLSIASEFSAPQLPILINLIKHQAILKTDQWKMSPYSLCILYCFYKDAKLMEYCLSLSLRDILDKKTLLIIKCVDYNIFEKETFGKLRQKLLMTEVKHGIIIKDVLKISTISAIEVNISNYYLYIMDLLSNHFSLPNHPIKQWLSSSIIRHKIEFRYCCNQNSFLSCVEMISLYLNLIITKYPTELLILCVESIYVEFSIELQLIFEILSRLASFTQAELNYLSVSFDSTLLNQFDSYFENCSILFSVNTVNYFKLHLLDEIIIRYYEMILYSIEIILRKVNNLNSVWINFIQKYVDLLCNSHCRNDTMLSIAIKTNIFNEHQKISLVNFLIRYGCDINERACDTLNTVLHQSIKDNLYYLFIHLLDNNAYPHISNLSGVSPINLKSSTQFGNSAHPSLRLPFSLKSLSAIAVRDNWNRYRHCSIGYRNSQLNKFLRLHFNFI